MSTTKKHHPVHKDKPEPKHKEAEAPETEEAAPAEEPTAAAPEPTPEPEVKPAKARVLLEEITPAKEGFNRAGVHVLDCVRAALERGKVNGITLDDIDAMAVVAAKLEGFLPEINALFPKKEKAS